jgi:hypothetical protein
MPAALRRELECRKMRAAQVSATDGTSMTRRRSTTYFFGFFDVSQDQSEGTSLPGRSVPGVDQDGVAVRDYEEVLVRGVHLRSAVRVEGRVAVDLELGSQGCRPPPRQSVVPSGVECAMTSAQPDQPLVLRR